MDESVTLQTIVEHTMIPTYTALMTEEAANYRIYIITINTN